MFFSKFIIKHSFNTPQKHNLMSLVTIKEIKITSVDSRIDDPLEFKITFHCLKNFEDSLEWKVVYVGSPESESFDQTLGCIGVGPVPEGLNQFVFETKPPNIDLIQKEDVIGVTIILITCSYMKQEFLRVGYYVDVYFRDKEKIEESLNQDFIPKAEDLNRTILEEDNPRVTYFPIKWSDSYTEIPEAVIDEDFVDEDSIKDIIEEEYESTSSFDVNN